MGRHGQAARKLIRGGTDQGALFSLKDPATGKVTGFDAGLAAMLAHYITGKSDADAVELVITTVDTRETLIQNGDVDAVFATYTITEPRAQKVAFAGPYYQSGTSVAVRADETAITGVGDLNGKNVVTQANSTAVLALQQFAPQANTILLQDDPQCLAALQQGRADAYVHRREHPRLRREPEPGDQGRRAAVHRGALRDRAAARRPVGQAVRERLAAEDLRRRQLGQALAGHRRHRGEERSARAAHDRLRPGLLTPWGSSPTTSGSCSAGSWSPWS